MIGWRARLGFLLPPGNPTVEAEMTALAPPGVSLHFNRMVAHGVPGALDGQNERTRAMAHTATSYYLGRQGEADLLARLQNATGIRVITAFGAVVRALQRLGVERVALGAPYAMETTLAGKRHLEAHGFRVVRYDNLKGVTNIYDETAERAYRLARAVDAEEAEAVFLSGTGMPTVSVLAALERDLDKPVISSASAMMWHALREAGVREPVAGYGRLLTMA